MVAVPPQQQPGLSFGSSASLGGFGTGSGLFVTPLDPKCFLNWRGNAKRDEPMLTVRDN